MQVNRYTSSPVALYNPLSFEEMAFAPTFLRQRHDQTAQALSDLDIASGQYDVLNQYQPIASQLVDPLQKDITNLANELATKGINGSRGIPQAMKLKSQYANLFGQSGAIGQLEGLKKQYQSIDAELAKRKDLEANPEVLAFARQQLQNNLPKLTLENGKLQGNMNIGSPNISRIFDVKERQDVYNNVIKNIQNDEKYKGYSISSLNDVSKLLQEGSIEYKDVDSIMQSMLGAVPQELYRSESTRLLANGYTPEEVQTIFNKDAYELQYDDKGKVKGVKYNTENPVIREMLGMAGARAVTKDKTTTKQFNDAKAQADYQKKLDDKVGGYDLPNQIVKFKNPWMEGITDEKSLTSSIVSLDNQLKDQALKYQQLGLNPMDFPEYTQMAERKQYLEGMIQKVQNTPYIPTNQDNKIIENWDVQKMNTYGINSTMDKDNPNYNMFLEDLGIEIPKEIKEGKRGWNTSDYSSIDYKVRQKLWKGSGKMPISGDISDPGQYFKNKQDHEKQVMNKLTLAEQYQDLSTGFTRENSKASIESANDYIKAAFTSLVFIDPNTGEEIAGTDTDRLEELGITPESVDYSSHSQNPSATGNYLWKVNNNAKDDKGNVKDTKSFLIEAPQQFSTKKAIMDLETRIKNPNVNLKQMEQSFLSTIADNQQKGINRVPLGNDYGDLFIGNINGQALPDGAKFIIKAPDGSMIPVRNPSQVFNYVLRLSQDNE